LKHIAIFHASKSTVDTSGTFKNGKAQEGVYSASEDWDTKLQGIELIIMDGCSMTIDLEEFTGVVINRCRGPKPVHEESQGCHFPQP
jgi:hypothetical protein